MRIWAASLIVLAGLAGATGMIEAAGAAHADASPLLQTSANFLLISGCAAIALIAVAFAMGTRAGWFLAAASLLLAGSVLFSIDLTARALLAHRLFPFAAPTGGSLMILGWLAAALAGAVSCFKKAKQ